MKRYSLANYIITIEVPSEIASDFGEDVISIGGEGSYLNTISIDIETDLFTTKGDATGGWVHVKNLDRHGTVKLTINQMSDDVAKLKRLFNLYYNLSSEADGLTITVKASTDTSSAVTCYDCVLSSIPSQSFSEDVETQEWQFNCGKIIYNN